MLALTRRVGESIMVVGPDGTVVGKVLIAEIRGRQKSFRPSVKIAFEFPPEFKLWRDELWKNGVAGNAGPDMDVAPPARPTESGEAAGIVIDSEVA